MCEGDVQGPSASDKSDEIDWETPKAASTITDNQIQWKRQQNKRFVIYLMYVFYVRLMPRNLSNSCKGSGCQVIKSTVRVSCHH